MSAKQYYLHKEDLKLNNSFVLILDGARRLNCQAPIKIFNPWSRTLSFVSDIEDTVTLMKSRFHNMRGRGGAKLTQKSTAASEYLLDWKDGDNLGSQGKSCTHRSSGHPNAAKSSYR